jgi:4-amino-4-deoxy-L-arabinose transferase-like glycosyltransferase
MNWRAAVVLTGTLALIIAYYWVHKPVTPQLLQGAADGIATLFATPPALDRLAANLLGVLLDVLVVGALFVVSGGLGKKVLGVGYRVLGFRYPQRVLSSQFSVPSSQDLISRSDSEPGIPNRETRTGNPEPRTQNFELRTENLELLISPLLGAGIIATLALLPALLGVFHGAVLWGGMALIALLTWREAWAWLREAWAAVRGFYGGAQLETQGRPVGRPYTGEAQFSPVVGRPVGRPYKWLITVFLGLALLIALAPPTSWDAMVYHLVGPQRWLESGRMVGTPDNFYLGFPKNTEMLFSIAISAFHRDTTAALIHWGFGVLALALTAALVRRVANEQAALTAVVLLLASYNLWELFGWGYVDLIVMAYAAACFYIVTEWRVGTRHASSAGDLAERTRHASSLLILLGVLVGLATGYKHTTAFLIVGLGVYVLAMQPRRVVQNGLLIALPALLCVAPWLLRGWLLYDNPVYPLAGFGLNWDAERAAAFTRAGWGMWGTTDAWQLIFLPLTATIFGVNQGPNTSFTLGPLLFSAPLLLPIVWRWLDEAQRRLAIACTLMALPMVALWTYLAATSNTGEQTRLAIALLPLGAIMGAIAFVGVGKLPRRPIKLDFLLRTVLLLTTLLALAEVTLVTLDRRPLPWLIGSIDTQRYYARNLGVWQAAMDQLDALPEGTQVRMLWELRTYHCPAHLTCIPDIMLDQWAYPLRQGMSEDAIFESWRAAGDDYFLLYHIGYDSFTDDDRYHRDENLRFPPALERHLTPVSTVDYLASDGSVAAAYTLYTWRVVP